MDEDDGFREFPINDGGDYMKRLRDMEKEMMKIDLSRGGAMPLDLQEYIEIFGEPSDEDLHDITQAYIKLYMKQGEDIYIPFVVDAYGKGWVEYLLKYNERVEEYELCSILKEHLDIYEEELKLS
jgi:hypothetical protein